MSESQTSICGNYKSESQRRDYSVSKSGSVFHVDLKSESHIHSRGAEVLALAYSNISFRHFNLYDNDVSDLGDISRASWGLENRGVCLTSIKAS